MSNRERTPTLIYNSRQQTPIALIAANVTVSNTTSDSVTATLAIADLTLTRKYGWNSACAGTACPDSAQVGDNATHRV